MMTMSRSISWRRLCPESVSAKIDEALAATYYILHQTGPTGFILKEDGSSRKIKVFLGDPNMCSCADFKKNHDLCTHILWVLLKKFRVPRTNPLIWQLALVEREIDEIILGFLRRQQPVQSDCSKSHDHTHTVEQREIGPEDVCPICQEDLLGSTHSLIYCRFGCGQSIHTKCMKIMSNHQKVVSGERPIQCPLCREDFGPIQPVKSKATRRLLAEKTSLHLGVACSHCHVCPIAGKCYKCSTCVSYHLCHACFSSNQVHILHPFQCRKHSKQPWRPTVRSSTPSVPPSDSPALPPALITSLQSRSLTENDYELLLQLDLPSISTPGSPTQSARDSQMSGRRSRHLIGVPERVINTLHVEPLDGNHPLIVGQASCQICGGDYRRGDWVKKLPCKHKFHRECIHEWLHTNSCCPVDGQSVYDQTRERRRVPRDRRQDSSRQRGVIPLTRALTVQNNSTTRVQSQSSGVSGQSSGVRCLQSDSTCESAEFTVSGQSIGGVRTINTPSRGSNSRCRRLTANSSSLHSSLSSATQRLYNTAHRTVSRNHISTTDTTLPDLSNVAITSLTRQRRAETPRKSFRSKRQLTVSIPSTESNSLPPSESHTSHTPQVSTEGGLSPDVSLLPMCSGYVQCEGQVMPSPQHGTSNDKNDFELQNYINVSKSPLHHSNGVFTCVSHTGRRGDNSISLPSLPVANQNVVNKPTVINGGRVCKGSLVRARKNTDPFLKDSSELDTSLQVSSFKLCPLPLSDSIMAASASLRLNV